jgi:hypothetical protein
MRTIIHSLIITAAVLLSLLACDKALAETYLILHIASHHSEDTYIADDNTEQPFNEFNPGIGIAYDINNYVQARAGFYDNSYNRLSVYAAGSLHTDINYLISIGTQVGVVSGYGP